MSHLVLTPHYHWSPTNQRAFLEELSISGNVDIAAKSVSMTKHSAYRLRHRKEGTAFKMGWEAAILIARGRLVDELMARAIDGVEEIVTRSSEGDSVSRIKQDNRLGMSMLARLDNRCEPKEDDFVSGHEAALARIIAQDFEAFLDMIEAGGTGSGAALFLAARCDLELPDGHSNLSQNSADCDEQECVSEPVALSLEEAAARMSIWSSAYIEELRTDFPPPDDFYGEEDGNFGDDGYERTLSDNETEAYLALHAEIAAPLRAAGELARQKYFGGHLIKESIVGPEPVTDTTHSVIASEARQSSAGKDDTGLPNTKLPRPAPQDDGLSNITNDSFPDTENKCASQSGADVPTHNVLYCQPQPHYLIPPWGERVC
jgi:hypothetical protein